MTPNQLCNSINTLLYKLLQNELVLDIKTHSVQAQPNNYRLITWDSPPPDPEDSVDEFPQDQYATIKEFLFFLNNGQFSIVLLDGSLMQIEYKFHRDEIRWHRLCYYPCPVHSESISTAEDVPLGDVINDMNLDDLKESLRLRSPLRFDFDPENASNQHPSSHLTINMSSCRVPLRAYMDTRRFIEFVLKNFYPETWERASQLIDFPNIHTPTCIEQSDTHTLHINWLEEIPTPT